MNKPCSYVVSSKLLSGMYTFVYVTLIQDNKPIIIIKLRQTYLVEFKLKPYTNVTKCALLR